MTNPLGNLVGITKKYSKINDKLFIQIESSYEDRPLKNNHLINVDKLFKALDLALPQKSRNFASMELIAKKKNDIIDNYSLVLRHKESMFDKFQPSFSKKLLCKSLIKNKSHVILIFEAQEVEALVENYLTWVKNPNLENTFWENF